MTTRNFRVNNGLSVGDIVISAANGTITGMSTAAPSADGDVSNKKYVDDSIAAISTTSISQGNSNVTVTDSGTGAITVSADATEVCNFAAAASTITATGDINLTAGADNTALVTGGVARTETSAVSVSGSSAVTIMSFNASTYRSAELFVTVQDSGNTQYSVMKANVVHDGTTAYISTYGSTSNYTGAPTLSTLSVDVNGGNVRLLGTNISDNSCVFKFQRTAIDI